MNRFIVALVSVLSALAPAFGQSADRPIVYSARYYSAGNAKSHFHLFRINADGTGKKQLTSGDFDEYMPRFLPSGRSLLFNRDTGKMSAEGEIVAEIRVRDLITGAEREATVEEIKQRDRQEPSEPNITVAADKNGVTLTRPGAAAKTLRYSAGLQKAWQDDAFSLQIPPKSNADNTEAYLDPQVLHAFRPLPGDGRLLLRATSGDSTFGHYSVYLLADEKAGVANLFAVAGGMRFSPDGKRFVATCARGLLPLGKGDKRTVWVHTLYVGTVKNGAATMRPVVSGLVDIGGYDWQPSAK